MIVEVNERSDTVIEMRVKAINTIPYEETGL
jgi:hypothetical protein